MEYNIVGAENSEVDKAIQKRWGSEPEKVGYAQQVALIAGEYSRNLPKGLSKEDRESKRTFRRNAKRKITEQARATIKPVGFLATFFFWAILSGIISWFVQKLMRHYFDEKPASCGYFDDSPEVDNGED
jgi:hypothetical protein